MTAESPSDPPPLGPDRPLTPAQERVWFLERLHPHCRAYRSQATLTFRGALDVPALEAALGEIVRRHESYRSTFPTVDGQPVQRVHPPRPVRLDVESAADGEALRALIRAEIDRDLDLEELPIVRWRLFCVGTATHVLLHAEHHLVHDGWSFNRFVRELAALYRARTEGRQPAIPEPRRQLGDLAAEQRRWLEGEEAERQAAWWREKLAGAPPEIALPYDRPRPQRPSFRGAAPRQSLSAELAGALRALSREAHATLFMTMAAGFVALLHRLSGQTDLCLGSGIANRVSAGAEDVLGMVLNNVVLRCDVEGRPTFRELLSRVRATALGAYAHQDLPFDRVVEAVRPPRDPARNPLFQVAFSFHDSPLPEIAFPGLAVEVDEVVSNNSAKFDLNVIVVPEREQRAGTGSAAGDAAIRLIWEHATDLFDPGTVERMIGRYEALLAAAVADPDRTIDELDLSLPGEEAALAAWNDTDRPYPGDEPLHRLFERRVAHEPTAVALVEGERRLTYGDLDRRAAALAGALGRRGVEPGSPVALLFEHSIEGVVAIVAVAKAGGCWVPLDPGDPPARLAFLLRDAGARLVVTAPSLRTRLPADGPPVVELGTEEAEGEGLLVPMPRVHGDDLACILYTSGSTGEPKGVAVPHRAVVRLVTGLADVELGPGETLLQTAPLAFDASHFEIWGALAHGACLIVVPGSMGPREIGDAIHRHGVTTLWLTAPLFHRLIDERPEALRGLRQLVTGGDVVSAAHVRRALDLNPGLRVVDGYGPTEATTFATTHAMDDSSAVPDPVPVGRPLANTRVHVLDGAGRPLGPGPVGELAIGGAGLARGYVGRPEETARRFVPDPRSALADARLYLTGDRARRRPDGTLELLGRLDRQVKVRGHRIEPGEVERVLEGHPAVSAAAVRAWPDPVAGHRLVAYVVPAAELRTSERELRAYLAARLPGAAIPTAFVGLEALPLDRRGKVDAAALPRPEKEGPRSRNATTAPPRTPTEKAIAAVWEDVLGRGGIGTDDSFFDLGGHSLQAMQVAARLEERLGLRLPLRRYFEAATVADLAAALDDEGERVSTGAIRRIRREAR
ncbi:MAG: amino acid adenylation domain-containing protein [Thermoanaerobaculia bacterium]